MSEVTWEECSRISGTEEERKVVLRPGDLHKLGLGERHHSILKPVDLNFNRDGGITLATKNRFPGTGHEMTLRSHTGLKGEKIAESLHPSKGEGEVIRRPSSSTSHYLPNSDVRRTVVTPLLHCILRVCCTISALLQTVGQRLIEKVREKYMQGKTAMRRLRTYPSCTENNEEQWGEQTPRRQHLAQDRRTLSKQVRQETQQEKPAEYPKNPYWVKKGVFAEMSKEERDELIEKRREWIRNNRHTTSSKKLSEHPKTEGEN